MKICAVESCGRDAYSKGFCEPHYRRMKRYDDPLDGKTAGDIGTNYSEIRRYSKVRVCTARVVELWPPAEALVLLPEPTRQKAKDGAKRRAIIAAMQELGVSALGAMIQKERESRITAVVKKMGFKVCDRYIRAIWACPSSEYLRQKAA